MKIPVIINNRDLLTWPKAMAERISRYTNVGEIIIIDNASTNPELLEWYTKCPYTVITTKNLGHTAPWDSFTVQQLGTEYYVVTDSDLDLTNTPKDTLLYLEDKMKIMDLPKVGLALDWKKVKPESPYYAHIQGYERNRWANSRISHNVALDVPIDTTFAMYKPLHYFIGGGSTLFPYEARHLPWELTNEEYEANSEFKYYIDNASNSSSFKSFLKK